MKKKNLLISILVFIVVLALGVVVNNMIGKEQERIAKEKDNIINLVKHLGVKKLKEESSRFIKDGDTQIIQKLVGLDDEDNLLAIIYVGETNGYKEELQVAFAIDVKTDKVVGFKLLENNETPMYLNALLSNIEFTDQFKDKALDDKQMKVVVVSGATPMGSTDKVIAPATSNGMNKVLKVVRDQYAKDTDFEAPAMLELKSSSQVFPSLNFEYKFDDEGTVVTLLLTNQYQLVSISDESYLDDAMALVNDNKVTDYISSIDGNTITIKTEGYAGTLISIAEVEGKVINSFTTDVLGESFYEASPSDFIPVFDAIKNRTEVVPGVSGATYTRSAVISARNILYAYLEGVE
jgi:Na+-translocating ferredoxin:NAD+ oxidoreductase RnfG subunit